jgi:phage terminase large subunit-like protein
MWLPEPAAGTSVCGGFDGSENDDWTAIKLETREGFLFTPRYGPDRRPTIWNPVDWNGRIPRGEVRSAWDELSQRFQLRRVYCDPGFHDETSWETEIEDWATKYGDEIFVPWPTNQLGRMYPAVRRFEADLKTLITHDGCPITEAHVRNARKIARGDRYTLGKPSQHQKIDAAVTSVICHEAAGDQRSAGWDPEPEVQHIAFGL